MGVSIRAAGIPAHYTTKIITCPSCGTTLELTISDIPEENIELACPSCGTTLPERGVSVKLVTPPRGIPDWLKKYGPWIAVAGLGGVTVYALTKKKKK